MKKNDCEKVRCILLLCAGFVIQPQVMSSNQAAQFRSKTGGIFLYNVGSLPVYHPYCESRTVFRHNAHLQVVIQDNDRSLS